MEALSGMFVFVKVVEEGSFSGAARSMGMPKSTVSRQVSRLEDHLKVQLLHRTTRSLSLTDVGASFYERATRIVAQVREAEEAVTRMHATPRGTLRLSAPLTFGYIFLGDLLAAYAQRYPEVKLDVVLTDRLVDIIDEGFDVAIRAGELPDSSLIARKLGSSERVICASPDYLERRGRPSVPDELRDHDCLRYGYEQSGSSWRMADGSTVQVDGPMVVNNGDVIRKAALAGLGICYLPRFMVGRDLVAGRLERLLEEQTRNRGGVYALYPTNRHLSAKVRAFVDFAVENFGEVPPWERLEEICYRQEECAEEDGEGAEQEG